MNSFKNRKLSICYPSRGTRQTGFDAYLANSVIDKRHPQTTPTYPSLERRREQTRGCSGEYLIAEQITHELLRLRYGFTPSAQLLALWAAYAYGVAASPTGTPANEQQTITATADGTVAFGFEGLSGTSGTLTTASTAAQVKAALEALDSIKPGNVLVTGVSLGAGLLVEFVGDLAKAAMPLFDVTGGITVVRTTAGSNKLHLIARSTAEAMTLFGLIVGFEGDSTDADKYKNLAVNSLTVTAPKQGKATAELDIVGSAAAIAAVGYTKPACVSVNPIYAKDCRVKVDGNFYTKKLQEIRWSYSNNIITDDDAFDWDSVDPSNFERGDRTTSFSIPHYGSKGDALWNLAKPEPTVPVELHFGRPGDRFSWLADLAKLRVEDSQTTFAGSKNKSVIPISGEAFEDETDGSVDSVEARISQTTAFLLTS